MPDHDLGSHIFVISTTNFSLPEVCAEREVDEELEGGVGDEGDVGRPEDVVADAEEDDVAEADREREEVGRVEEGVDAEDDA